jgi:hypothetical protein
MPTPPSPTIRDVLLELVYAMEQKRQGGNLQQSTLLQAAMERLVPHYGDEKLEQAILTQWHDLFRQGLLAPGHNLNNPDPPFFHLTESGRRALANVSHDPSNPSGYLKALATRSALNPVAKSYLVEALDCYASGFYKAAAVMLGVAAESLILELRDQVTAAFEARKKPLPKGLTGWHIRSVTGAVGDVFDSRIDKTKHEALRDRYDTFWSALAGQIRTVRNEAGHPKSVDPVEPEAVHASLLLFPELASLVAALSAWVASEL